MDLFIVLLKSGSMSVASRYALEDDAYYYFDGLDRVHMDEMADITPIYLAIETQRIANLTLLSSVSFDYKGTRYMVTGTGNYVLSGSVFVKLSPTRENRALRLLLNGLYLTTSRDYD